VFATDVLEDAGYKVIEAVNAQEALTLLEARPDVRVLFTDVEMPTGGDMDGLLLAHLVSKRWPNIGIVITSGRLEPKDGDLPEGARFLAKPYRPSDLIKEVHDFIQSREPIIVEGQVTITPSPESSAPVIPARIAVEPVGDAVPEGFAEPVQT
jgi:CheY-like chemotaxis protein